MPERLPLFPLGTVLLPGQPLPLHVFEERYRLLVRRLLELPEGSRELGVVRIREGREVDAAGVSSLEPVGCVASLRHVDPHEDGRFDVLTVGTTRLRVLGVDTRSEAYLVGEVERLPEEPGAPDDEAAAGVVRLAFEDYLRAVESSGVAEVHRQPLPEAPGELSYLVAASVLADPGDRQRWLAASRGERLRDLVAYLRREAGLLQALSAVPSVELLRLPVSPN